MSRLASPEAGAPFHRLGRTSRTRWWRALLSLVGLAALAAIFAVVALEVMVAIHDSGERPWLGSRFDQAWELASELALAWAVIPAVILAVRWAERRPAGLVSSVAGRIRWRWLGRCVLVAGAFAVATGGLAVLVDPSPAAGGHVDWKLAGAVSAVGVLFVPLQASAEEYLFRGYLAQALGAYIRGPVLPAIVLSLIFGIAHGSIADQGVWTFVDRTGFGLIAAWLVVRTGGLEAAIALHAAGNVVALDLTTLDGQLDDWLAGDETPASWWLACIDLVGLAVAAYVMARSGRRRLATRWWPQPPKRERSAKTLST
jgi:membrane protease YdiL (CAAX protease family)